MGVTERVTYRRQSEILPTGGKHWSAAFPRLEAWIQSKPASTSASEISSQAGEGDFEEDTLVGTPEQQVMQVLVVQAQNGANMASGTAITAHSTSTTAPSTAPMQVAGPSTMEPIVELLGQDTPSVIQGARPDVRIEQTAQSTQRYGTLPYISGPQYTAPLPHFTAPLPQYTAPTAPLLYVAPYANMPAMSARPATPMGYYGQGNQFPFAPNPGWMTDEQLFQQQQLLREKQEFDAWRASRAQANIQPQPQTTSEGPLPAETNVDNSQGSASVARARPEDQITSKAKAKRARSDLVGFILNRKKSELGLTQDLQFLGIHLRLDLGKALLLESKAREIVACACHLSSLKVLNYTQVSQLLGSLNWASGLIPLGRLYLRPLQRHFHLLGLTDWFTPLRRSDPLFLANLLRRWLDPRFLTSGIPICPFQGTLRFSRMPPGRAGAPTWGIPRFRVPGPSQTASSTSTVWSSKRLLLPYSIGLLCFRAARSWSPLTIRQWFHISTSREGLAPPPCCV